jgi:hypothetical protein
MRNKDRTYEKLEGLSETTGVPPEFPFDLEHNHQG